MCEGGTGQQFQLVAPSSRFLILIVLFIFAEQYFLFSHPVIFTCYWPFLFFFSLGHHSLWAHSSKFLLIFHVNSLIMGLLHRNKKIKEERKWKKQLFAVNSRCSLPPIIPQLKVNTEDWKKYFPGQIEMWTSKRLKCRNYKVGKFLKKNMFYTMKRINFTSVVWFSICRMCDGGTVEYLRDLVCHKEALQVNQQQINEKNKEAKKQTNWAEKTESSNNPMETSGGGQPTKWSGFQTDWTR